MSPALFDPASHVSGDGSFPIDKIIVLTESPLLIPDEAYVSRVN